MSSRVYLSRVSLLVVVGVLLYLIEVKDSIIFDAQVGTSTSEAGVEARPGDQGSMDSGRTSCTIEVTYL